MMPALATAPLPAHAQDTPEKPVARKAESLDSLFEELKAEADPKEAKRISDRIWARWRDSGSATGNLLLQWANTALNDKKFGLSLDFLDQLIVLMPDYAEAWNQRATLHYVRGNYAKSMSDINRVLTLEPRHFGALAGMAAIFTANGNDELALRAWEQMLAIYPANREAQTKVGELADKLAGSRT
nr:hypothetical protein [Hoeflea marina]